LRDLLSLSLLLHNMSMNSLRIIIRNVGNISVS